MKHPASASLKQSLAFWCFNVVGEKWSLDRLCEVAKELARGGESTGEAAPDQQDGSRTGDSAKWSG